jgi:hypothetical protein
MWLVRGCIAAMKFITSVWVEVFSKFDFSGVRRRDSGKVVCWDFVPKQIIRKGSVNNFLMR